MEDHNKTGKMNMKDVYAQPERVEITLNDKEMNDRRNISSIYADNQNNSSNMFDMERPNLNGKEILDPKQVAVGLKNFENVPFKPMTKNRRVVEDTIEQQNLIIMNIVKYIGEDSRLVGYADEPLLPLHEACAPLTKIIHNISFYVKLALNESVKQSIHGLTTDESASIRLYMMEWEESHQSLYAILNYALNTATREGILPYFKYLKLFLTALIKLPSASSQIIWRGVNEDLSKKFLPGSIITWWTFSSCTATMAVLENNIYLNTTGVRTILAIETINGRVIRAESHSPNEDEILLLPGTQMVVESHSSPAPNLHIIHLKQIIPNETLLQSPLKAEVNYSEVRKSIAALLNEPTYDDGSYGPLFVRLSWHASGTYSHVDSTGGSNGGCIRLDPQNSWEANKARDRLASVYRAYPGLTYADLYTLAGVVAIENMGGPTIKWRSGRVDYSDGSKSPPDGRLPDASKGAQHIRDVFYRMGFNDSELVALIGAHSMGRCHIERSGYDGDWTPRTTSFSNDFFRLLSQEQWEERNWNGSRQFEDVRTRSFLMLPTDMALFQDLDFKQYVLDYANDQNLFSKNFASAFEKLLELGVNFPKNS
ncbi:unnamed protein product [Rotaria sp. Silwood1]|nr:unnamed protein product [Rotaria sp. Silwood1]